MPVFVGGAARSTPYVSARVYVTHVVNDTMLLSVMMLVMMFIYALYLHVCVIFVHAIYINVILVCFQCSLLLYTISSAMQLNYK